MRVVYVCCVRVRGTVRVGLVPTAGDTTLETIVRCGQNMDALRSLSLSIFLWTNATAMKLRQSRMDGPRVHTDKYMSMSTRTWVLYNGWYVTMHQWRTQNEYNANEKKKPKNVYRARSIWFDYSFADSKILSGACEYQHTISAKDVKRIKRNQNIIINIKGKLFPYKSHVPNHHIQMQCCCGSVRPFIRLPIPILPIFYGHLLILGN